MFSKYSYTGTVYVNDQVAAMKWHGETMAETPEKARSNLKYQFRKKFGFPMNEVIIFSDLIIKH